MNKSETFKPSFDEGSSTLLLFNSVKEAMELKASGRTRKYVLENTAIQFDSRLDQVCSTIEKIRTLRGTTIIIDGESYSLSEYKMSENLQAYVHTGRFWMTKGMELINDGVENFKEKDYKAISPMQFNRFFELYNENQSEDGKVKTTPFMRKYSTYGDFHYAYDGDTKTMKRIHDGTSGFGIEACQLGMIPNLFKDSCELETLQCYSKEKLGLWALNLDILS